MDLLCTESIVTHSDLSLYRYKKQTPVPNSKEHHSINCNCKCNCNSNSNSESNSNSNSNSDSNSNSNSNSSTNSDSATCSSDCCCSNVKKCNTAAKNMGNGHSDPEQSVNLIYVLSSVATPSTANKSTKQAKSTSYQSTNKVEQCDRSDDYVRTAENNEKEHVEEKNVEEATAHMVVTDPIFISERCLENALKSEEKHQQIQGSYFKTVQKDITPAMRKIVAEWMMEVCAEEKCQEEVVLLAINYMDRFLFTKSVRKTQLQILAAACLLLASKLREPNCHALSAERLVFYTDNSIFKEDLIKWELYVLSRLGWDLSSVTPLDFLELLINQLPSRCKIFTDLNIEEVRQHAQTFISLAAKEHRFSKYTASTIAASSIAASMNDLKWHLFVGDNIHFLFSFLTDLTSVEQDQLQQCMIQMEIVFKEHCHKFQPFFLDVDKSKSISSYFNDSYYQRDQCHQTHIMSVLPKLAQTWKYQAQSQKDIQELPF